MLAALLIVYPAIGSDFFLTQIGAYSLILGMIALSLMLLAGYGGMVSLAQISVAGIAGYAVAVFGLNNSGVHGFGWPFWVVVPFATLIAAIASALIGWISVRTEGIYTIMITLAIATAFFYFAQQNYSLFNGFPGFTGIRAPEFWGVNWRDPAALLLPLPGLSRRWPMPPCSTPRARPSGWRCRRPATTRAACARSASTSPR